MAQVAKRMGESDAMVPLAKRARNELVPSTGGAGGGELVLSGIPRTSTLEAPIMLLAGHGGEIFTAKFHPDGSALASAGFDRQIYLWNVHGECENYAVLPAHSGAIMDLQFSADGKKIFTAATDKTVGIFDFETGARLKRFKGHQMFVNSCHSSRKGPELICSASDDGTVKVWDPRSRAFVRSFDSKYPLLACCFNENSDAVITGGIDTEIRVWDLKSDSMHFSIPGHTDTITGLALDPTGNFVLSNSMDNTARIWDIRPYAPPQRCAGLFTGHQHNFEKNLLKCAWSKDGKRVACGSGDRFVYIWETQTRKILYKLPGHNGSVNDVQFHPNEPIILSVSSDKQIYLGEIEPS
ncbi:U5 small nuclear ribonucleoprotein 40 kDa protein-like [Paramacrobiotus metropolitanus]|uniref:U5 small nuclear ribonucleoprotein 40 kDa protein-like n=1 Tax=Paramacrobiotus metropolitanus TaxID=2943436 RepID=UPI002445CEE8|nr:U5 small nuclear ribonucleoprotein 40 kDa protein-like [Paramacrobiotus metropolitanus]